MARQIWKFYVREGCETAFVAMNTHDWPEFFRGSSGYRGTSVSMLVGTPRTYLTEDHWASRAAFDDYVDDNRKRFDELSALHRELYEGVEHIGFFDDEQFTPGHSSSPSATRPQQ